MITVLPKIIPVLVGGLLAIGGGVAAQVVTHWLSARRDREKLIREKAEELISALYDHRDWLSHQNNRLVFGAESTEMPSPLDRASAIQELYFPDLSSALAKINRALVPIIQFQYENAKARLEDKAKWVETYDSEEFNVLYQPYLKAFHEAVREVVQSVELRTGI
nr:hypothetical protein BN993_04245 [Virgibacillus halodenitrificans]